MRKSSRIAAKRSTKAQLWNAALVGYDPNRLWWFSDLATDAQLDLLKRRDWKLPRRAVTKGEAWTVIRTPTPRQKMALESMRKWVPGMNFDAAHKLIAEIAECGWET